MNKPKVICLCGSTRFLSEFHRLNGEYTLRGCVVLSIGFDQRTDTDRFGKMNEYELAQTKARLDVLHYQKIEMADVVVIINKGGYIGESTMREMFYAESCCKEIRFLEIHSGINKIIKVPLGRVIDEATDESPYMTGEKPSVD